jgi:hypothetical protein
MRPLRRIVSREESAPQIPSEYGELIADSVMWLKAVCVKEVRDFCEFAAEHWVCGTTLP